jgi:type VI secretion system protein
MSGTIRVVSFTSLFWLMGCSSVSNTWDSALGLVGLGSANSLKRITVQSTTDSNMNNPIVYDLVFIYDKSLVKALTSLSGPQWFAQKNALLLKHGQQLTVISADLVPLTPEKDIRLPDKSGDALSIVLFANYVASAGQVAATLEGYKEVHVIFEREEYQLKAGGD